MSTLEHQLREDRALRDAARALFKSDLALIRTDLSERGVAGRLADRIGDSTMDMVDDAVDYAEANKGPLAAIVAALVLWFGRGPILDALGSALGFEEEKEPETLADRLRDMNPFNRE